MFFIKHNWLKLFWLIPIALILSGVFGFVITIYSIINLYIDITFGIEYPLIFFGLVSTAIMGIIYSESK